MTLKWLKATLITTITASLITSLPLNARTPINTLQNTQGITLSGQVKSIVGNDFVLEDETGQIIVDAGPRWWHQINLSQGETVTVVGELDEGEFDAFSITRSNGEVIQIRPTDGPPPWSGGRRNQTK